MQHPFSQLEPEYANLLAVMRITRQTEVTETAGRLLTYVQQGRYAAVSQQLGIPQIFIATSFEREASSNFNLSPAQGDPWRARSIHVPRGRGPFLSWQAAALDAYRLDGLDQIGKDNWTWTRLCYEGELFNGFGYRAYGIHTPYDWAGTNDYVRGKYVADGQFSFSAVDQQLGIVPIARTMALAHPELDIPGWPVQKGTPPSWPGQPPIGIGGGQHNTAWLQAGLNHVLKLDPPLAVDNSYGRKTRLAVLQFQSANHLAVDGLAGPETYGVLEKVLGDGNKS